MLKQAWHFVRCSRISLRRILSRLRNAQASLAFRSLLQNFASQDSVTTQKCSSKLGISFAAPESRLLHVGCNGGSCRRASYVSGAEVLQRSETIAPTHGLRNRPDKRCNGVVGGEKSVFTRTPSRYVGQKSPVFMRTDFGTYQERGYFNGRKPSLLRGGCNGYLYRREISKK